MKKVFTLVLMMAWILTGMIPASARQTPFQLTVSPRNLVIQQEGGVGVFVVSTLGPRFINVNVRINQLGPRLSDGTMFQPLFFEEAVFLRGGQVGVHFFFVNFIPDELSAPLLGAVIFTGLASNGSVSAVPVPIIIFRERQGRDRDFPQVKIREPKEDSLLYNGDDVRVAVDAIDRTTPIAQVEIYLDNVLMGIERVTGPQGFYSRLVPLRNLNQGTHFIHAIAYDSLGNFSIDFVFFEVR